MGMFQNCLFPRFIPLIVKECFCKYWTQFLTGHLHKTRIKANHSYSLKINTSCHSNNWAQFLTRNTESFNCHISPGGCQNIQCVHFFDIVASEIKELKFCIL